MSDPAPTPVDRISQATLELIVEKGISGVSMSEVARRAGVARQTLYNHFQDVESILYTTMDAHQSESLRTLSRHLVTLDSPTDRLEHLVRHTAAVAAHGHPNLRHGLSARNQELIARHDIGVRSLIETTLIAGVAAGQFRADIDPARDALLLQRMIEATTELVVGKGDDAATAAASTIRIVMAAVAG